MHSSVSTAWPRPGATRTSLIRSTEAEDPFLQARSLDRWSQEYTQLTSGLFLGRTVDLSLGPVQLFRETMNQAVDQKSHPLSEAYTVGMAFQAGGTWQNRELGADTLFILPPGEPARLRTPAHSDIVVATIDRLEFQRQAQQELGVEADFLFQGPMARRLDGAAAARFRATLNRFLLCALDAPQTLDAAAARKSMADGVIQACLQALNQGAEAEKPSRDGHRVHRAIVERAREHILAHRENPPTVADLCAYLNMSRRGLHYAFMQVLDINSVTFIRNVRLHAVRRALLQGAPSVSAAAREWGFWHLGMFSCYYKELFGELPSETTKKSPQLKPVRWLATDLVLN
ncbi:helix-turn-helix domain-containing protein [Azohydromonas caseinilytica]|uniref:Helix-turn-helix domain-containing protein n=1 Tax=Azohydromonas caseinilytica TaxID=2728836 RepID=A0A848FIK4_9BURK|nr:helix-turn-helix domain-containing protein [Azohydromonas caseinilytica]NML18725.1 helix-turn-helix domain-containing protein [Azohydromonas caseinilytica]